MVDLFIYLFIQQTLLLHIKARQEIVCHQDGVDVIRIDTQPLCVNLCQFRCSSVAVTIGEQKVKVACFKPGLLQERLDQLRHLMPIDRTHDSDAVSLVQLILTVDGLGNTDRVGVQFLRHMETVSSRRKIEHHVGFPPVL